jgi:hypothetical protein
MSVSVINFYEASAEVTDDGTHVRIVEGDARLLIDIKTAEAIATALRFHQMGEWGDREELQHQTR